MKRRDQKRARWIMCCFSVVLLAVFLSGCRGVEPEKRAYPLVLGIDWIGGQYQMIYGMANLAISTGQDKSGGDESKENQTLQLTGDDVQEILELYQKTQQYHLDMGHVQAVVFGEKLLENKEAYRSILHYLEQDPAIGDGTAAFRSAQLREILELNGSEMESLGMYLTGIYENRPGGGRENMVTLQKIFRSWHERGTMEAIPILTIEEGIPKINA